MYHYIVIYDLNKSRTVWGIDSYYYNCVIIFIVLCMIFIKYLIIIIAIFIITFVYHN